MPKWKKSKLFINRDTKNSAGEIKQRILGLGSTAEKVCSLSFLLEVRFEPALFCLKTNALNMNIEVGKYLQYLT